MKTLLITGGTGFIGSHCVIEALNKGYKVVNLDLLTYAANPENLREIQTHKNYKFIRGDIRDQDTVNKIFEEFDIHQIMHLAAESHVDRSITGPKIFVETNVYGTQILLEAAKKHQIEKFLHVSTDEVYGDLTKEEPAFTEESQIKPSSPYSASKTASDHLVNAYHITYGFPSLITRCSNNYGPHQDPSKLIPVVINKAKSDEPIPIYGKGENIRDWLYVEDHVNALFTVLEKGTLGETYNIGGNNEQTNINITKKILQIMNKPENLITFVEDRLGHDYRYAINSSKIQKELNWQPTQNFDQLLEKTINWYLK